MGSAGREFSWGIINTQEEHIACLHPAEVPTIDRLSRACWGIFYTRPDRDTSALDGKAGPK